MKRVPLPSFKQMREEKQAFRPRDKQDFKTLRGLRDHRNIIVIRLWNHAAISRSGVWMRTLEVANLVVLPEFEFTSEGHSLFADVLQDIGIYSSLLWISWMTLIDEIC